MDEAKETIVESREPDLSGRQLGDFRLLRRLGQGAMAEVYLAEQVSLRRQVALKVLKRNLASDETYVKRFQREAQAAASLVHANIVQIHEVGQIEGVHYIAQEYVQGQNLRQWLARNGPPDLRLALLIMRQVAAALAKAAEQGIVHRDIKPENIMLTRTGEVKVADFGLARLIREGVGLSLTECGVTMGTPLYMSPEQVEGRSLDPRSDLYSFGITCYQMLAGAPPFSGETALSVALQHAKKQAEPLENHRSDLPPGLCRAIHKMLAKTPDARFQSALELLRELRRIQTSELGEDWGEETLELDLPAAATVPYAVTDATQRLDALMKTSSHAAVARPRWTVWAAGLAASIALGAALAMLLPREKPLLAESEARPGSPKQETVFGQWLYATQVGTKDAWQSVVDHFPQKQYWVNRANQQLARMALREGDLDAALIKLNELAALDETEAELKAFGLAGKAWVLTRQGRYEESAKTIDELWPIRERLQDPVMHRLLDVALKSNRDHLGDSTDKGWSQWLESLKTPAKPQPDTDSGLPKPESSGSIEETGSKAGS